MTVKEGFDPADKLTPDKLIIVHNKRVGFKEPDYVPFPSPTLYPSVDIFPQEV